jgi:hypothetical protein
MTHEIFELLKEEALDVMYKNGPGGEITAQQLFEIFEKAGQRYQNGNIRMPIPCKAASKHVKSFEKRLWVDA